MALGKTFAEFTMKITSLTYTTESENQITVQGNLEGTAPGFGPVLGTITATNVGGAGGEWKFCGAAYLANGDTLTGVANGTYESIGVHKWSTRGIEKLSNGRTVALEGEVDLASRSWTGKLIEWD